MAVSAPEFRVIAGGDVAAFIVWDVEGACSADFYEVRYFSYFDGEHYFTSQFDERFFMLESIGYGNTVN